MSRYMKDLAVNSGQLAVFHFPITGLLATTDRQVLWILPKGAVILDAFLDTKTADGNAVNCTVEAVDDVDGTSNAFDVVVATGINVADQMDEMTRSSAICRPLALRKRIHAKVSGTATGAHVILCTILATRPGPEPQ